MGRASDKKPSTMKGMARERLVGSQKWKKKERNEDTPASGKRCNYLSREEFERGAPYRRGLSVSMCDVQEKKKKKRKGDTLANFLSSWWRITSRGSCLTVALGE